MQKLIIGLKDHLVKEFEGEWPTLKDIRTNGQHYQLEGHVLVGFSIRDGNIYLLHPDTAETSGHFDVCVSYRKDGVPTFHKYAANERFFPAIEFSAREFWPTGDWSLLTTVLAIEAYLERKFDFRPLLKIHFLNSLHPAVVADEVVKA